MTGTESTTPTRPIRVVLVDDHRMFRTGVRSELAEEPAPRVTPGGHVERGSGRNRQVGHAAG